MNDSTRYFTGVELLGVVQNCHAFCETVLCRQFLPRDSFLTLWKGPRPSQRICSQATIVVGPYIPPCVHHMISTQDIQIVMAHHQKGTENVMPVPKFHFKNGRFPKWTCSTAYIVRKSGEGRSPGGTYLLPHCGMPNNIRNIFHPVCTT